MEESEAIVAKLNNDQVIAAFGDNELNEIFPDGWDTNDARWQLALDYHHGDKMPVAIN